MHEERRIKAVLARNTLLFFVVFALIFSALGVVIYQIVGGNIFRSADQQLMQLSNDIVFSETGATEDASEATPGIEGANGLELETPAGSEDVFISGGSSIVEENPSVIYLIRDQNGTPLDIAGLYSTYPDYIASLPFDPSNLGAIYSINQDGHHYRGINTQLPTEDGEPFYLQALVNVDAEVSILQQFTQTLVICLVVALILCAAASYFLSKKTIQPIARAWKKQTEFVQNASHELRTPLSVISVTQELLLEDPHARIIDHFEDISLTLDEAQRLSRLTEDLLLLTSIDSEAIQLHKSSFDLDRLLAETVSLFEEHAALQGKTLATDFHGAVVYADRDKIKQVVNSLVDNALKYTEAGDTISLASKLKGGQVTVTVADTGIGVSDETIERAFDRFYREDKARSKTQEGLGLGLSIAGGIIEAHQGAIEIRHNDPQGTCVSFTLPATSAKDPL